MREIRNLITVICLLAISISGIYAQTYKVDWRCVPAAGGSMSGGQMNMDCSIGQAAAGYARTSSFFEWIGFLGGNMPAPTVVASLQSAKTLPDGAFISIAGKIATAGIEDFGSTIYLEESDRSSGIRVQMPALEELNRGSVANVIGTMSTTSYGVRYIAASVVMVVSTTDVPLPVGMNNLSVGGGDLGRPPYGQYGAEGASGLNNVGLLIKIWGRVTGAGKGYIEVDDGSDPVRVSTVNLVYIPTQGSTISVIGISSLYSANSEHLKLVLPRRDDDVSKY